jgi:hypothetical protein
MDRQARQMALEGRMDRQARQMALDALLVELGEQVDKIVRHMHEAPRERWQMRPMVAFLLGALHAELRMAEVERVQDYEARFRDAARQMGLRHAGLADDEPPAS